MSFILIIIYDHIDNEAHLNIALPSLLSKASRNFLNLPKILLVVYIIYHKLNYMTENLVGHSVSADIHKLSVL